MRSCSLKKYRPASDYSIVFEHDLCYNEKNFKAVGARQAVTVLKSVVSILMQNCFRFDLDFKEMAVLPLGRKSKERVDNNMKKTISLTLAALLCALLLAACNEAGIPSADPSKEPPGPSGMTEASDSPSANQEDPPGLTQGVEDSPSPSGSGSDAKPTESAAQTSSVRLGETPDAGREYLDKLIFLGDSTTYGIGYYYNHGYSADLVPPSQVWTPKSGTLTLAYYATATIVYPETGEEISIKEAVERAKPEYLVITLGVNGISFMDEAWFVRDYTSLVETVKAASPETKIILNSIYPVTTSYPYQKDINNDKIRAANGWVEQVATDTGVRFLYCYESVVGEDGNLPESSSNGDGLHLNGQSFAKVMAYIRTHEYR